MVLSVLTNVTNLDDYIHKEMNMYYRFEGVITLKIPGEKMMFIIQRLMRYVNLWNV